MKPVLLAASIVLIGYSQVNAAALDRKGLMQELRVFAEASGVLLGALNTCREFEHGRRVGRRTEAVLEVFLRPMGVRHFLEAMLSVSDMDIAAHESCDPRAVRRLRSEATVSAGRLADHLDAVD